MIRRPSALEKLRRGNRGDGAHASHVRGTLFDRREWRAGRDAKLSRAHVLIMAARRQAPVGLFWRRQGINSLSSQTAKAVRRGSQCRPVDRAGNRLYLRPNWLPVARRSGEGEADQALCRDPAGAAGEAQKGAGEGRRVSLPRLGRAQSIQNTTIWTKTHNINTLRRLSGDGIC